MTKDEAIAVVAIVRSGAIPQEHPPTTIDEWEDMLLPLPFAYCQRVAQLWKISVPVDDRGRPVQKFISEPAALLTACGVGPEARSLLDHAAAEGGTLGRSIIGTHGGWEYIPPGGPIPQGVHDLMVHNGEIEADSVPYTPRLAPTQAGHLRALPGRRGEDGEPSKIVHISDLTLARPQTAFARALVRSSFLDQDELASLPPALRRAAAELQTQLQRAQELVRTKDLEAQALADLRHDITRELAEGDAPLECAKPALVALVRRIAAADPDGARAVLSLVAGALWNLSVTAFDVKRGPAVDSDDDFDDTPGEVKAVRVVFGREK